ncbi:fungal-specific transcription factor domain-containing protein [Aspergillus unguis]
MEDRVTKKRASRACAHCRVRKVRCDLVTSGLPCTNCRLDEVPCKLADSVRARRPYHVPEVTKASTPAGVPPREVPGTPQVPPQEFPISLTFEDQIGVSHGAERPEDDACSISARSAGFASSQASTSYRPHQLPVYIEPLPPHIRADDIEYLARKDALTIPADALRDELLRHYIKLVHPFMPILDVNQFVTSILKPDSRSPVSLLLFQAVMFVGISFTDIDILRCHGYSCRKSARKRFFNRVRLLYGLDCEPDRLCLLQALLFMTFWYDAPEDEKDTWHWMGITLSLAQVMGIHRDPETMRISPAAKRHRIRLWWACLMRDRLLALGIRRPARLRPDDCNVRMLRLEDFDLGTPSEELIALVGGQQQELYRALAVMCIELAKLCICLGHILLSQYSVLPDRPGNREYFTSVMVFPRHSDSQKKELERCDHELDEWHRGLSAESRYTVQGPASSDESEGERILRLHQSSLYMIYLTALGVLHRPQIFRTADARDSTRFLSGQRVTDAAIEITQLAYDMQLHDQLRYLSTSSIPAFVSAALIHLFEMRSPKEDVRNVSIGRFFQCMQALRHLQEMYASADYAVYFLESVIRNTGTQVPLLSMSPKTGTRRPSLSAITPTAMFRPDPVENAYPISPSSLGYQAPGRLMSPCIAIPHDPDGRSAGHPEQSSGTPQVEQRSTDGMNTEMLPLLENAPADTHTSGWNEIDTLLCAFINFESDPAFAMSPSQRTILQE